MSRFSPQVLPNYGPAWTQQLAAALQTGLGTYQQVKEQKHLDERRQLQDALMTQQLGERGIHKGVAPLAPAPLQIKSVPGAFNPMTGMFDPGGVMGQAPSMNSPLQPQAGVTQLTKGYYQDANEASANAQASFQAELAQALAKRDAMRPGDMADYEAQKAIDLRYSTHPAQQPKSLSQVDVGGRVILTDPVTGKEVTSYGKTPSPKSPSDAAKAAEPTQAEMRGGALFQVARDAAPILDEAGVPGYWDTLARRAGGQQLVSERQQVVNQAGLQLASSYLYLVSGATASPQEVEKTAQTFIPQVGDSEAVLQRKAQARKVMLSAMQTMAGRSAGPTPSASTGDINLTPPKTYSPNNPFAPRNR